MLRMSSNTLDAIHTPSTTLNRLTVNALATPVRKPSAPHQHHHLHPHHHNHSASAMQTPVSAKRMKCWTSAKKHSFYARDNVANFLGWCRTLGVRDVLLFESEDLVLARRPKNVLLCLLEVARIACRHLQLDLSPTLIQLEQEIEMQEQQEQQEQLQQQLQQLTDDQTSDLICPEKIRDYAMSKSACDPSNRNGLIEADKRSSTGSRLDCSDFLLATLPNEPKSFEKCDTTIEQVSFSNAHSRKGAGHEEQVDGDRTTGPKEDGATDGHNDKESDVNSIDSNEENWKYWKAKANEQSEPASNAGIISNTMPLQPLQVVAISPQTARIRLANVVSHVRPALAHLSDTGFTSKLLELQQQAGSENTQRSIACSNNDDVDIEEDDDATAQSLGEDSRSNSNSSIDTQSESKTSNCSQMTISQLDQKVNLLFASLKFNQVFIKIHVFDYSLHR